LSNAQMASLLFLLVEPHLGLGLIRLSRTKTGSFFTLRFF
jgi:hypothetical protein